MTPLLDQVSFWDGMWWIITMFIWIMAIWIFIAIFADILGRHDITGWAKAGWVFVLFFLPLLGGLIYLITRPKPTKEEVHQVLPTERASGPASGTDDIAMAHEMLKQGELTQAEFDEVKARALGLS